MLYITGIHALNLPCSLETCGDWHASAIQWKRPNMRESDGSLFGEYGIETCTSVPENPGTFFVANTLRALLDLIEDGKFSIAQGAREDFICNEKYTDEFMRYVMCLKGRVPWEPLNDFMCREYKMDWVRFKDCYSGGNV